MAEAPDLRNGWSHLRPAGPPSIDFRLAFFAVGLIAIDIVTASTPGPELRSTAACAAWARQ